ncbi:MAG TPA: magnesium transporter CorA family protein, partial [Acidimicrobiales bacterium]|nr:magnesium transporter CorA family protein [Acidimicrobiales bacterium]
MEGHLITVDGKAEHLDVANINRLMESGTHFWADIEGVDDEVVALLSDTFHFHPLAVEDAEHFGQRPKIDMYEDFALLVVYGATAEARLAEVHCFYTESFLVTVHHQPCPDFSGLAERLARRSGTAADHVMLLYRVVDTLVDGYFPVLSNLDDKIDELEDEILERPTEEQLGRLFDMKRSLISMRKVVTPQRDMFASLVGSGDSLPGMTPDAERYFRDLY